VIETSAVLDLTEAFLDRGAFPEPRIEPDQILGVGGDVVTMKLTAQTWSAAPPRASASWSVATVRRRRERGSALSLSRLTLTLRMIV